MELLANVMATVLLLTAVKTVPLTNARAPTAAVLMVANVVLDVNAMVTALLLSVAKTV